MNYYVYIISNWNNKVIYIGRAENLLRRIYQHKNKLMGEFSQKYNVDKLVYYEVYDDKDEAAKREWKLKKWKRIWKDDLIVKFNPEWDDLYGRLDV